MRRRRRPAGRARRAGPAVVGRLPDLTVVGAHRLVGKTSTKDLIAQLLARARRRPWRRTARSTTRSAQPLTALRADRGHPVPGRRDGRPRHRAHPLPVPGSRRRGSAWCSTSAPRTSASSAARTASPRPRASWSRRCRAGRHRGAQRRRPRVARWRAGPRARVLTFGEAPEADVRAEDVRLDARGPARVHACSIGGLQRATSSCCTVSTTCRTRSPRPPSPCVGHAAEEIADGLAAATPLSAGGWRSPSAPDGVTVVNDAYNANPDSMRAALRALAAIGRRARGAGPGRCSARCSSSGDDVGRRARRGRAAGRPARRAAARGRRRERSRSNSAPRTRARGVTSRCTSSDRRTAVELLRASCAPGDVVLVKASQGGRSCDGLRGRAARGRRRRSDPDPVRAAPSSLFLTLLGTPLRSSCWPGAATAS